MKIKIFLLIVAAIILWASSLVGIRAALTEYDPLDVAVLRSIVSSVTLLPILIFGKVPLFDKWRIFSFFPLGLVLAINMISLNFGAQTVTAGETTLIVSTSQIFQVLLAVLFLKEIISARFLIGLSLCVVGIIIIAFGNSTGFSFNMGILYLLFASISNAVFFILQKSLLKKYKPLEIISYAFWIATLIMLPFGGNALKVIPVVSINSTLVIIYVGIIVVVAQLFWSKALSKINATRAATYLYSVPVMTIIIGFLWLQEMPSIISLSGGAIILCGVIVANLKITKRNKVNDTTMNKPLPHTDYIS